MQILSLGSLPFPKLSVIEDKQTERLDSLLFRCLVMSLVSGANCQQNFVFRLERYKTAMCKKIVSDEINKTVKRDTQTYPKSRFIPRKH